MPDTYEHEHAVMEAQRNESADAWDRGAPMDDAERRLYENGFTSGWVRRGPLAAGDAALSRAGDLLSTCIGTLMSYRREIGYTDASPIAAVVNDAVTFLEPWPEKLPTPMVEQPAASTVPATSGGQAVEQAVDEFLADYEMLGEDAEGRDGYYRPNDDELFVIKDAIMGLMADDGWLTAYGRAPGAAPAAVQREAEPLTAAERAELERLRTLVNTPTLHSFRDGVMLEAVHQRERWGSAHDGGKTPADWFWLVGYLAGKALHAQTGGNTVKALHHTISTAAALANWHAAIAGDHTAMRPGIDSAARGGAGDNGTCSHGKGFLCGRCRPYPAAHSNAARARGSE